MKETGGYNEFRTQFDNEARALSEIRDLQHPNLIQWLAAFTQGDRHYLMFPWADGGNLREFWEQTNPLDLGLHDMRDLVRETLVQFRGLTDALARLHLDKHYRHGDIKPENILRFIDENTTTGILQVADFGLAKQHNQNTVQRGPTATRHTTLQYESPEADNAMSGNASLSRLSDIWSLGCVMLEYLIWLLGGIKMATKFTNELKNKGFDDRFMPFYYRTSAGSHDLHPEVATQIDRLYRDPECGPDTALGRLLRLIHHHMLVVKHDRSEWHKNDLAMGGTNSLEQGQRATATELCFRLDQIIKDADRNSHGEPFLFAGHRLTPRSPQIVPTPRPPVPDFSIPVRPATPRSAGHTHLKPEAALRAAPRPAATRTTPPPPVVRQVRICFLTQGRDDAHVYLPLPAPAASFCREQPAKGKSYSYLT